MQITDIQFRHSASQYLRSMAAVWFEHHDAIDLVRFSSLNDVFKLAQIASDHNPSVISFFRDISRSYRGLFPNLIDAQQSAYFCLLLAEWLENGSEQMVIGHRVYREGKLYEEVVYASPVPVSIWFPACTDSLPKDWDAAVKANTGKKRGKQAGRKKTDKA